MGIKIIVAPEFARRVVRKDLQQIAERTLRSEAVPRSLGLAIVIAGDKTIRVLNRQFLQKDAPTDVLSFSSAEKDYLGDIVISCETASRNASAFGWRVRDELRLLVVHGLLHLLGYEDLTPRGRNNMWRRQEHILGRVVLNGVQSNKRRGRIRSRST
jgi:probable rRNA maturation factor